MRNPKTIPAGQELDRHLAAMYRRRGLDGLHRQFAWRSISGAAGRLHLVRTGRRDDRLRVLFIPGTGGYALCYAEFLLKLAACGIEVTGLDPRGHGLSDGVKGDFTLTELLEDVGTAMEHLAKEDNRPLLLLGSSQGGIVALHAFLRKPGWAGAICHNLADTGSPEVVRLTRSPRFFRLLYPALPLLAACAPHLRIPVSLYLDLKKEPVKGFGNAADFLAQDPLAYRTITLRALHSLGYTPLPDLSTLRGRPLLVLQAEHDRIFPRDCIQHFVSRAGPSTTLEVMANTNHLLLTEHGEETLAVIRRWLAATGFLAAPGPSRKPARQPD